MDNDLSDRIAINAAFAFAILICIFIPATWTSLISYIILATIWETIAYIRRNKK